MATIRITNLKLRALIGIFDWERELKQDVVLNIRMDFDASKACASDDIKDTLDYKTLTKRIIDEVESSEYYLLEKLTRRVLDIVLKDKRVQEANVRIDKPFALRFADSVSVELSDKKQL